MAASILATSAVIDHVQCASDEGITVLLPTATVRRLRGQGKHGCTLRISFDDLDLEGLVSAPPAITQTVSIREAARRLIERLEPLHPRGVTLKVETARSRVRAAIVTNHLPHPITEAALTTWLDAEVDAYLDSLDSLDSQA